MDLNHRPSGYACYFGFRRSATNDGFVVWTFPSPAIEDGCLPSSLYTFSISNSDRAWLGVTLLTASPNLTGDPTRIASCGAHGAIKRKESR